MDANQRDKSESTRAPLSEAPRFQATSQPTPWRRGWVVLIVTVTVFLAGFLPMWLKAGRQASQRDAAQREVRLLQLDSLAAAAVIDARRGDYESARQSASRFFTALRSELDRGPQSALALTQQEPLKALLARRDDLITLLARSDPASAERLTEVYLAFRESLRGEEPAGNGVTKPPGP